ncbi:MAG: phosphotransferase [Alphaproteobacteria bacterium]
MPSASLQDIGLSPQDRVIPLRGFSGCRVVLVDTGQEVYVRKLAKDSDYNKRLLLQADKQKSFCSNEHFQAVKVRASGNLPSGIAYIDMDYVQGVTAAEMLEILPLTDIQHWAAMLLDMASSSAQGQTAKTVAPAIFHNKIADLKRDLTARKMMTPPVTHAIGILQDRPWDAIPVSPCHGDLTLENIIVSNGRFYLIDFLDSFADSWHIDVAKLLQDLIGGWSFRHKPTDRI